MSTTLTNHDFERTFETAGTGFFGYDSGPGHPTTLLLLHGNGGTSGAFTATGLFQRLANTFRVLAFDARGFGSTPPIDGPLSYLSMADDAVEVLNALGVSSCFAIGFSMGGGTAQALAIRHPDRILGVVAGVMGRVDTSSTDPDELPQVFLDLLSGARAADEPTLREVAGFGFSTKTKNDRPELIQLAVERLASHDWDRASASGWAEDEFALVMPSKITKPLLAIAGSEDRMIHPRRVRHLAASVTHGHYVEIPNAGHALVVEQPELLAEAIEEFVLSHADVEGARPAPCTMADVDTITTN